MLSSIWSFTIILGCPWYSNKSKSWQKQNSKNNTATRFCWTRARSAAAYNILLVSDAGFYIRGISRVTRRFFTIWVAFYSLFSSVTYPQILTTNFKFSKIYIFQILKVLYSGNFAIKFSLLKSRTVKNFIKFSQ
jgi:hypothetical protein